MQKINWKKSLEIGIWSVLIILLLYTRFVNPGWGLPYPMHPDERNMADAVRTLSWQNGFNPHFYAYGQFPLYLGYILMNLLNLSPTVSLRLISAVVSVVAVFVLIRILKTVKVSEKQYWLILIFSPVLIQFAHFGTTESLLILFYVLIIYYSLLFVQKKIRNTCLPAGKAKYVILVSLFSGLALATKVSSIIYMLIPLLLISKFSSKLTYIICAALFFIIFAPHTVLSFREFYSSVQYESSLALGQVKVFYTRQFEGMSPVFFQIRNIFPYALGWPVFILGIFGLIFLPWKKKEINLLRLAFIIAFIPNAFLFAKWTRFMAPTFPVIILFSVLFLKALRFPKPIEYSILAISVIPGILFLSIYQKPDVRFQASEWIYKHIPAHSVILSETANVVDIPLENRNYNLILFNFYDLDSDQNLQKQLTSDLSRADYIIVPSRRIFKNHPATKYPLVAEYYMRLFDGRLGFKNVVEFNELHDENAEETWTVFDHPVIRIYKRM